MELPPPHVLLQLDAIIVAQRESDGARVVATASAATSAATPPRPLSRWHGEVKDARALACLQENPKRDQSMCWKRYEAYKSATTVSEFLAKGGTLADLAHDVGKGFVWYLDAEDSQEDGRIAPPVATVEPTPAMTEPSRRVIDGEVMPAKRARGPPKARQSVAEPVARKRPIQGAASPKPVEMRRVGDAEWRYFASQRDAAKAFNISKDDVSKLINDPSTATEHARVFEARPAPAPKKRERVVPRRAEGAKQKANGKWANYKTFPGREFDDLDEYRAAKKQHAARRAAYSDQL